MCIKTPEQMQAKEETGGHPGHGEEKAYRYGHIMAFIQNIFSQKLDGKKKL